MFHVKHFDVVVIGGGHAGCEASLASARMGVSTLLVTMDKLKIAEMSCNPSIGGVGKGQLVKEIDALGGEMGRNADFTGIQFKRLNTRKGSAVQSSRCQSDKRQYAQRMQAVISSQSHLEVIEGEVKEVVVEDNNVHGVKVLLASGEFWEVCSKQVVITAGTFMRGLMHCGLEKSDGGRFGEKASHGLSDSLKDWGFTVNRLKTGTPARLIAGSIDFTQMEEQGGDIPPAKFSFWNTEITQPQVPCFLTYTNEKTHEVIRQNLKRSPLYSGQIKGVGPRYCPSIEDKVVKFPEKPRHQLFFEPEALSSDWIYPNGISTSLPPDVQEAFIRTIPGCAEVKFARHGYAVEYDCIDPRQLSGTLEAKHIRGLFLAGQTNGTSGYEEAAAQGLIAGINAALKAQSKESFIVSRAEGYIGVMIDDLISMGVSEPYRMFTSRAEFRLSLREDNADYRLSGHGFRLGLLPKSDYDCFLERSGRVGEYRSFLKKTFIKPTPELQTYLASVGGSPLAAPMSLESLLKRPEVELKSLLQFFPNALPAPLEDKSAETLEIEVKYMGYISMQKQEIERLNKMQDLVLPEVFDYRQVIGLSYELREKLSTILPRTLAEAAQVSGVTPAALTAILFHFRQKTKPNANPSI